MKLKYLGDQARTYPRYISVGEGPPKTLEAVPGGVYDVIPATGWPEPIPTDGLWEPADDTAPEPTPEPAPSSAPSLPPLSKGA